MARYWIYANDEVSGPYTVEQLIRVRSFSRQTLVCVDDASGKPNHWISPAEIPELEHIFKAAHDHLVAPPAGVPDKAPAKPVHPRPRRAYTPAVTLKAPATHVATILAWVVLTALVLAAGIYSWNQYARRTAQVRDSASAKVLVENARLPAPSPYSTLRHYIEEKGIKPRWELESARDALYHVTLSWYASASPAGGPALVVYAFEANVQAQTVRGLNTAASKLLSDGFPAPHAPPAKAVPAIKEPPSKLFTPALDSRREAFESGDFPAVWSAFSQRKKSEMSKAGISQEGFIRLQGLTHRVESSIKQTVLKTQPESDTDMLVLIKQSQSERPDIFVKQLWVFENGGWKLDDEQKRAAAAPAPATPPPGVPVPAALPGMSH